MKNTTPQIHHHYYHVGTNKIAARLMFGFVFLMMSLGFFFSEPHSTRHPKTKISAGIGYDLFNSICTWGKSYLASYAKILNSLVTFFGWKKSFLWFWYLHVGWGSLIYFGIPILVIALLVFVLKREKIVLPILLSFYMYHHGLGFLIKYHKTWCFCLLTLLLLSPWVIASFRKGIVNNFIWLDKKVLKKDLEKLKNLGNLSTIKILP